MSARIEPENADAVRISLNPAYGWQRSEDVSYAGHHKPLCEEIKRLMEQGADNLAVLKALSDSTTYGSGIVTHNHKTVAWVDHIRTRPVYYGHDAGGTLISNDSRAFPVQAEQADDAAALEFALAGFATLGDTLYKNIKCLLPGEVLVCENGKVEVYRYFRYLPAPIDAPRAKNLAELETVLRSSMQGIIDRAAGRPIWVPLSAGLDSRIILCLLHEMGHKDLNTFTYGPDYNFEALYARRTAEKLGVPWQFVHVSPKQCREEYESRSRREYTPFADGYNVVPCMREFVAIRALTDRGVLPKNAIIINGQSGDYITGGHVHSFWYSDAAGGKEDFMELLVDKHYDLWSSLKTKENLATVRDKIEKALPELAQAKSNEDYMVLGECWEYEARQNLLVVNGQRTYEYFGYDWELPLWERSLVEFYRNVPYDQKRGQSLFKEFLQNYNYKGLFPKTEPNIWRWPLPMIWVVPAAQIVGLFSKTKKTLFYALMKYYGHYANQYAFFPFSLHRKTYFLTRNMMSLMGRQWFVENPQYPLKKEHQRAMRIGD